MMLRGKWIAAAAAFGAMAASGAWATEPAPWAFGFQTAATPVKAAMSSFHGMLLVVITLITIFVLGLLAWVVIRFRADRNPNPSKTTHNTLIEVVWTVVPVLILVIIAIPSFRLLYFLDRNPDAEMTIKVVGHQWYWQYEYPDQDGIKFDSYMIPVADLKPGQKRLLEVDNRLVLPVGTTIRVLVTGNDVMHSWFVPSLGVQNYAFPGRTNETWIKLEREGVYYGQCNQICGVNHGFMPIAVEGVSKEAFQRWVGEAKKKFAGGETAPEPVRLARIAD
ncbi:cytochrome c oxidase subunit 2 [Stella humosa]|uniref:Cytochrome c oxidase subunit 2 n=2 Tax=Stella humosa TaxID=94 RepID=A0A3N1LPG6_9PROT|nr:cytochrome c oxidase subunit 2 [Stella humosa]